MPLQPGPGTQGDQSAPLLLSTACAQRAGTRSQRTSDYQTEIIRCW
jgi:hypothetical protein